MSKYYPVIACLLLTFILIPAAAQEEINEFEAGEKEFTMINEVWSTPSKSQGRTGTCWSFSTTSFIESEAYRITGEKYDLSEIYTVYNAYKEKGERYLRLWGNNAFGQGGLSHDFLYLVPKYGIVRKSDYSGMLEGQEGHNHGGMFTEFKAFLEQTVKDRQGFPDNYDEKCAEILGKHIGELPETITVEGNEITPVTFAKEHLKFDPDNYIELTSYSYIPFYEQGELLVPDNWMRNEGYYNVPLDEFVSVAKHALENGYSIVLDLDVSEKTNLGGKTGIKYMPQDLESGAVIDQEKRDQMFDGLLTTDDHLMHTTGLAKDEDGIFYFYTKDSGGPDRGPYKGFNYISENYFRGKVLAYFVHKDALPQELRTKLGIE